MNENPINDDQNENAVDSKETLGTYKIKQSLLEQLSFLHSFFRHLTGFQDLIILLSSHNKVFNIIKSFGPKYLTDCNLN